jgi:D-arabinose 5-phosphate isomerase GutQ
MSVDDMAGLKYFFNAYEYLTDCVRESLRKLDQDKLKEVFKILIEARNSGQRIIVDGQGRSLESILLAEECLEHNGFSIILPVRNANLRPPNEQDVFFFNSGSGSGSPYTHAQYALEHNLTVLGMTYNPKLVEEFPHALVLLGSENKNSLFAPLGTEFELTSAITGCCIAHSVCDTAKKSMAAFEESSQAILQLFVDSKTYYEDHLEDLMAFIDIISGYVPVSNPHKVYFRGVGRDEIINSVAAIRYGHLQKLPDFDLRVIQEGHWELRTEGDLAVLTSGSGATSQTLDYAMQAFISGMKVIGVTSFADSDLGRFCRRADGCLVVPGRKESYSLYTQTAKFRTNYLPEFELNCYITLDALLAQVAANHGITEDDMKKSHRPKEWE